MKDRKPKTLSRRDLLFRPMKGIRERDEVTAPAGLTGDCLDADQALKRGDYPQARELYQRCIASAPENKEARKRLAYAGYRMGDAEAARAEFESYLQRFPGTASPCSISASPTPHWGTYPLPTRVWKDYFNLDQPIILREINLQLALLESGEPLSWRKRSSVPLKPPSPVRKGNSQA
jgi:tetratricopeptide (TPR) repeat protein